VRVDLVSCSVLCRPGFSCALLVADCAGCHAGCEVAADLVPRLSRVDVGDVLRARAMGEVM
jgi:hypothetical protein